MNTPNPWVYPGVYANENSQDFNEHQMSVQRIAEEEFDARQAAIRRTSGSAFGLLGFAAALTAVAVATKRGNTIPRAVGAGMIWPVYFVYVLAKGD